MEETGGKGEGEGEAMGEDVSGGIRTQPRTRLKQESGLSIPECNRDGFYTY